MGLTQHCLYNQYDAASCSQLQVKLCCCLAGAAVTAVWKHRDHAAGDHSAYHAPETQILYLKPGSRTGLHHMHLSTLLAQGLVNPWKTTTKVKME